MVAGNGSKESLKGVAMEDKIKWHSWDKDTFHLADTEGRPILLSISAVWCHWCHVMDQTTYSDEEVVKLINSSFVPIRVDTDKRPDINRRYNMGGWPTTAFLNPQGEILTGSTYIPAGPMRNLLKKITHLYRRTRGILNPTVPAFVPQLNTKEAPALSRGKLSPDISRDVADMLEGSFDSLYGGFGPAPKFPLPNAISFLLGESHLKSDNKLKRIALKTLDEMAAGEIFDGEMGGFFRYATAREWGSPHYEKMLEDNARLLSAYLEAFQITENPQYRNVAEKTLEYVDSTLKAEKDGGFCGSQDALESYYTLPLAERKKRVPPKVDTTIYSGWNALMASAYLKAAAVLEQANWKDYALKTLSFLHDRCFDSQLGMKHFYAQGKSELPGILADQVQFGLALLDAYESTGDERYITKAVKLAGLLQKNLGAKPGGFFDLPEDPQAQGHLRERDKPIYENSLAAKLLTRLSHLTKKREYLSSAEETLKVFGQTYRDYGLEASSYAQAVLLYVESPIEILLVGEKKELQELHQASLRIFEPRKVIRIVDASEAKELEGRKVVLKPGAAYICSGQKCSSPAFGPEELRRSVSLFQKEA